MLQGLAKNIVAVFVIVAVAIVVAYGILTVVGNIQFAGSYNLPDSDRAKYTLRIINTGNVLLAEKVESQGDVFVLDGYWELNKKGDKFVYREKVIRLDPGIFGVIEVRRRG